jgi:hypothetical protein
VEVELPVLVVPVFASANGELVGGTRDRKWHIPCKLTICEHYVISEALCQYAVI